MYAKVDSVSQARYGTTCGAINKPWYTKALSILRNLCLNFSLRYGASSGKPEYTHPFQLHVICTMASATAENFKKRMTCLCQKGNLLLRGGILQKMLHLQRLTALSSNQRNEFLAVLIHWRRRSIRKGPKGKKDRRASYRHSFKAESTT